MMVQELIELLKRHDPEQIVFLENDGVAYEVTECSRVRHTNSICLQSNYANAFELI